MCVGEKLFWEADVPESTECCDVCSENYTLHDYKKELKVAVDALNEVGLKGEVKLAEWIRGSNITWTNAHNKSAFSYGNHCGRDINFWRSFIKQCHVKSLIKLELRSIIKSSGNYSVHGMYHPLPKGKELADDDNESFLLPVYKSNAQSAKQTSSHDSSPTEKKKRDGKGCHILTTVRQLLSEPENWLTIKAKKEYHFPGVFSSKCQQQLYYVSDINDLEQTCDDQHFLWSDIQLSKGQLNKARLITADIAGKREEIFYRSAPCAGVKVCSQEGCNYIVPIRDRRPCPDHGKDLVKTSHCPVEFVYINPKESSDKRR